MGEFMKNRIRVRRKITLKNKNNKKNILIMIIVGIVFTIVLLLNYIGKKISPVILNYAELEARKFSSLIINSSISKNISNSINIDDLFVVTKNSNNEISTIDFNPIEVNNLLVKTTELIQNNLKKLEEGRIDELELPSTSYLSDKNSLEKGIIFEIPSGLVFNNPFFNNLGPKIPVRISLIGEIFSEITTKVTNYGINNALIEIRINLKLTEQVFLPVSSNQIEIETSVPLTIKLIQGTVPNYYLNGINQNSSSFTLPTE